VCICAWFAFVVQGLRDAIGCHIRMANEGRTRQVLGHRLGTCRQLSYPLRIYFLLLLSFLLFCLFALPLPTNAHGISSGEGRETSGRQSANQGEVHFGEMFTHSAWAVRLRAKNSRDNVPQQTVEDYVRLAYESQPRWKRIVLQPYPHDSRPRFTTACHAGQQLATVVFPSRAMKARAPRLCPGWTLDDTFSGLTILRNSPEPDMDICTIHGLNGNAFDTFASQSYMWPLDFLPSHPQLQQSRVMTYGYSSRLQDNTNVSGLAEWASGLLYEVSSARITPQVRYSPAPVLNPLDRHTE
jgi:hypothetical protein